MGRFNDSIQDHIKYDLPYKIVKEKYYKLEIFIDFYSKEIQENIYEIFDELESPLDRIVQTMSGKDIFFNCFSKHKESINKHKDEIYIRINDETKRKIDYYEFEVKKLKELQKNKSIKIALRSKKLNKINYE